MPHSLTSKRHPTTVGIARIKIDSTGQYEVICRTRYALFDILVLRHTGGPPDSAAQHAKNREFRY